MQRVHEQMALPFFDIDASNWSDDQLQGRLEKDAFRPFDLEREPAWRVILFTRSPKECVILIAMQHTITDYWSMTVFASELMTLYAAETQGHRFNQEIQSPLPPLRLKYTDYVKWEAERLTGSEEAKLWQYWGKKLASPLPELNISTDRPREPLQTYRGDVEHLSLSPQLTDSLMSLARTNGATLFMTLLAAYQVLLHKLTQASHTKI